MPFSGDPPRAGKWAFSYRPTWKQRYHYESYNGSNLDIMAKRRIASRAFGFRSVPVYPTKELVEPMREAPYYAPEEERLSADVDGFIKQVHRNEKCRKDEILNAHKAQRAYEQFKLLTKREEMWDKALERDQFMRTLPQARVRANRSGVSYNIITMKYDDSYAGRLVKYQDDLTSWREVLRKLFLETKSTGCQNFNILNWKRRAAKEYPVKPPEPEPDPASLPKPRLKKVMVYPKKPPDLAPIIDGKLPEQLDFEPAPPPAPQEYKVRDVLVRVNLHHRAINASNGYFYIGRDTMSSCPIPGVECPAGDATVLQGSNSTGFALATLVPGVQNVYLEATHGLNPGALAYNGPHSSPPAIAITDGFTVDDNNFSFANAGWAACPTQGSYEIHAIPLNGDLPAPFCQPISIKPVPWTGGAGAYQYDTSE